MSFVSSTKRISPIATRGYTLGSICSRTAGGAIVLLLAFVSVDCVCAQ